MPLITDGDVTEGFFRTRKLVRRIYEQTFMSRSPVFKKYVRGVAEVTKLPPEKVLHSQPVRNFLRKLIG